ncbi:MAG: translation elongation factor 4 [Myxococcota bacterium]|jgi:GTP-binding protein LepA|nr:translation elongation factor 4 [Myxococcota bacterium]
MAHPQQLIRNFSIIAHIDHGKSTLADRFLQLTGTVSDREMREQFLDRMDLERERGITIKAQTVRIHYRARDGQTYQLNLIDTPGHVDFSYEVSRSLYACEGALLVVDASQGVQAQTVANVYLALEHDLEIIPVLNKVDLPSAEPERVRQEIEDVIGLDTSGILQVSAKTGEGLTELCERIVQQIPPPRGSAERPLRCLITDSWYDSYRGIVSMIRVVEGTIRPRQKVRFMASRQDYEVQEVGVFSPGAVPLPELSAGEVGFLIAGVKELAHSRVGDTVTETLRPAEEPLPGFVQAKQMVFSGVFPTDTGDYEELRDALEKLRLNDSSFTYQPETSEALGFGFRCGFLGLLHMEIIQERLEREYDLDLITTPPSVRYRLTLAKTDEVREITNPSQMPMDGSVTLVEEPMYKATIHVQPEFVGAVLKLCEERRGEQIEMRYAGANRVIIVYKLPINEVVFDFHDRLKAVSKGYASLDYEFVGYEPGDLIRLDILVNGDIVDALSVIVHRDVSYKRGLALCQKLKELIPRQMFEVAIQAAVGSRVVARTNVKSFRKDVTAKCYGGDITRKRKLLEKQKKGRKRMKQMGNVEIPQEAFHAILQIEK